MPTWPSAKAFAAELDQAGRDLQTAENRKITKDQAVQAQKIARRAAANDLGGDPKFSGWKPRLATVVKPVRNDGHLLHPTRTSAGPWTVAEFGRHADGGVGRFQGPSLNMRTGRTRRRKDGSISTANTRRTGVRWNGMTAGKGTASDAIAAMDKESAEIAEKGLRQALRKHFDVT